jgi:hypothetical protein
MRVCAGDAHAAQWEARKREEKERYLETQQRRQHA